MDTTIAFLGLEFALKNVLVEKWSVQEMVVLKNFRFEKFSFCKIFVLQNGRFEISLKARIF